MNVGTLFLLLFSLSAFPAGANGGAEREEPGEPFRDRMRRLVIDLSEYAKQAASSFSIITQNGNELFHPDDQSPLLPRYIRSVDGVGQESLWYGNPRLGDVVKREENEYLLFLLDHIRSLGKAVLVTDYAVRRESVDASYRLNAERGFLSFAADRRELDAVPAWPPAAAVSGANEGSVKSLADVRNFLYLINPDEGRYGTKEEFLRMLASAGHDLLIADAFFGDRMLAPEDVAFLKVRPGGGERLVFAYLSIGEAEDYRWYWRPEWSSAPPSWLGTENPDWDGNYRVRYWSEEWWQILFGSPGAYLDRIIAAGFDGVYLDTIDTWYYYERQEKGRSRKTER